jgi:membrane-associated protease RseP (regulator of RpoE activity)
MSQRWWMGAVAVVLATASSLWAAEPKFKVFFGDRPQGQHAAEGQGDVLFVADGQGDTLAEMGEYWLGLQCSQPTPVLRAQLGLSEKAGLVVEEVAPDSPAAKAGLKQHDVLVKVNDKPLEKVMDLIAVINKVKEGKLTLEVIRAGKHESVTAVPAKRPTEAHWDIPVPGPDAKDREAIQGWIEKLLPGEGGRPLQFRFFHPGAILPPELQGKVAVTTITEASLPDGYNVTISRHGSEPAKVVVKKDKETWEATEGDLGKLPDKVRPKVEQMLGGGAHGITVFGEMTPGTPVPLPPGGAGMGLGRREFRATTPPEIERRLQEMDRQIEQIRKSVDELRGQRREPRGEPRSDRKRPEKKAEAAPER